MRSEIEHGGAGAAVGVTISRTLALDAEGALVLLAALGIGDSAYEVALEDEFILEVAPEGDGGVVVEPLDVFQGALKEGGGEGAIGGHQGDASEIDVVGAIRSHTDETVAEDGGVVDQGSVAEVAALAIGIDAGGALVEVRVFVGELDGAGDGSVASDGDLGEGGWGE